MASPPQTPVVAPAQENHQRIQSHWSWLTNFKYDENNEKPADARTVLLVVAALITAVTFQAGVNPPGGVWQDNDNGHTAGRSIYAAHKAPFYVFLISNTLALSSSIFIIVLLTHRFPFHFEVMVATASMIVTYGSAVFAVTPNEAVKFRYLLFTAALPYVFRFFYQLFRMCKDGADPPTPSQNHTAVVAEA